MNRLTNASRDDRHAIALVRCRRRASPGAPDAIVGLGEVAAHQQRNAHRLEIAGADRVQTRADQLVLLRLIALHRDAVSPRAAPQHAEPREPGGLDARRRAHLREQVHRVLLDARALVAHQRRIGAECQQMLALEAEIERHQPVQAAQEQARADQQQQRQRDLRHHQRLAHAHVTAAHHAPRLILQRRRQRRLRRLERRDDAEQQAGRSRRSRP